MERFFVVVVFLFAVVTGCSEEKQGNPTNTGNDGGEQFRITVKLDSIEIMRYYENNPQFADFNDEAKEFYASRDFNPAWFINAEPKPQVDLLIERLKNADEHGLVIEEYNTRDIRRLSSLSLPEEFENEDSLREKVVELDLSMTNLFFQYAEHLYLGVVDPDDAGLGWYSERKYASLVDKLTEVLKGEKKEDPYAILEPAHPMYHNLKESLAEYRKIKKEGGIPTVREIDKLQYGDSGQAVISLKKRLAVLGDYPKKTNPSPIYDSMVVEAVVNWQDRHGLTVDGVIGPNTLEALNRDIDFYIDKIIINMERFRWIPDNLGAPHVMVNIPDYKLYVKEDDEEVMEMKVVTGEEFNQTVVFSDSIEYVSFSPYWNVPYSIATEEILPKVKNNPGYLSSQNMQVLHNGNIISPSAINWHQYSADNFPYRFRQKPGSQNSLGTVKFIFPNEFNIYLHDTPAKHLFQQEKRAYSHGCIRIEKPLEFAKYLLRDKSDWNEEKIESHRNLQSPERVYMDKKVPVYILYFTSWVDDKGNIYFIEDIYGRDNTLENQFFADK